MTLLLCSNNISLKCSMRHADKMYLKLVDKNDIMTTTPVLWCQNQGMLFFLKMDSYTGRRKTKNKWSYENYMVLCINWAQIF